MVRTFRKNPIVVNAVQFLDHHSVKAICDMKGDGKGILHTIDGLRIHTAEGVSTAKRGDWVVMGVEGELYPVREDIFKKTYVEIGA
jgi:hypothetical protein